MQYWVTFAFLTVFESAVNAVYWFRKLTQPIEKCAQLTLIAFYYTFKFVLILWMALPQTA
jgi:receptor expression-enhancing protein 5/6